MGEMRAAILVENPRTGARSAELIAIADTGATLTMLPSGVLRHIGIEPTGRVPIVLADGRRAHREVGSAVIAIDGESTPCRVPPRANRFSPLLTSVTSR